MAITFQNNQVDFVLPQRRKVSAWIKKIVAGEKRSCGQINFLFTTDNEILKANKHFLNHDSYTDIITFDESEGTTLNGDIMISIDRVRENATKFKVDLTSELHRVMIHGVLHLCGYKDKNKDDIRAIRKKEDDAIALFPKIRI